MPSKRNAYIKSNEWFGEGQEKLQEGSEVESCEQLGDLNPPIRLLKKSASSTHDKLASNAQGEQEGNVQQLSDEMPKKIAAPKLYEQSESDEVFIFDQIYTCKQLEIGSLSSKLLPQSCIEFSHNLRKEMNQHNKEPVQLPFKLDWKGVLGPKLEFIEIGWYFLFTEDHR